MDGVTRLIHSVMQLAGVDPAKVTELMAEIPKLQENIPQFAKKVMETVIDIQARQIAIEEKLDRLIVLHGENVTSQALPASPEVDLGAPEVDVTTPVVMVGAKPKT